jgi:peptide/nickel transport system permease protein
MTLPRERNAGHPLLVGLLKMLAALLGQIGGLLSAAVLVEVVFAWPGMGRTLVHAVTARDYPVLVVALAAYPILVLIGRLLAELLRWIERLMQPPVMDHDSTEGLPPDRWRRAARTIWTVTGLALLLLPLLLGAIGLTVSEDAALQTEMGASLAPPSVEHPFGTDQLGRDILARTLRGGSVSLGITVLATGIVFFPSLLGGALVGFLTSRRTWWSESLADLLLLPADILLFIPAIPTAIVTAVMFFGDERSGLTGLTAATAIALLPRAVRVYQPLWTAVPEQRKWLRVVLAGPGAIILGSLFAAFGIVVALDFLGVGVVPPTPSLGFEVQQLFRSLTESPAALYVIAILWVCSFALYTAADALVGFFWTKEALVHLNE